MCMLAKDAGRNGGRNRAFSETRLCQTNTQCALTVPGFLIQVLEKSLLVSVQFLPTKGQLGLWPRGLGTRGGEGGPGLGAGGGGGGGGRGSPWPGSGSWVGSEWSRDPHWPLLRFAWSSVSAGLG